jgi:hypothetical protein
MGGTKTGRFMGVSLPALVPNDCGGDCVAGMERQQDRSRCQQDTPWAWETLGYHRCMASRTFNIPKNKGTPKIRVDGLGGLPAGYDLQLPVDLQRQAVLRLPLIKLGERKGAPSGALSFCWTLLIVGPCAPLQVPREVSDHLRNA